MIKLVSILSAFLILIQSFNVGFREIAQLDEFLEHASFHKAQYGDNLLVFISKHYGELKADHNEKHQEEKDDHEQLPFEHNSCTHHSVNAFVLVSAMHPKEKAEVLSDNKVNFYYIQREFSCYQSEIFKPPKRT